jgi:diguanylate cyclase (GGDEF)-like protein
VAEKLRTAIARLDIPGIDGRVTGSFGIATYPTHGVDSQTLLRKADRALYVAKENGRHRIEVASVHGAGADEPDTVAAS